MISAQIKGISKIKTISSKRCATRKGTGRVAIRGEKSCL
jgi:hypothetical protein